MKVLATGRNAAASHQQVTGILHRTQQFDQRIHRGDVGIAAEIVEEDRPRPVGPFANADISFLVLEVAEQPCIAQAEQYHVPDLR